MADRMEREIEEILTKLDVDSPADDKPISIMSFKSSKYPQPSTHKRSVRPREINPAAFLLIGAVTMIAGLILSNVWGPLIWLAFGGVVLFLASFAFSFRKSEPQAKPVARGHYWRDRYIEYQPTDENLIARLRRRFRR